MAVFIVIASSYQQQGLRQSILPSDFRWVNNSPLFVFRS